MALPQSGVTLVAQNASSFFSTLDKSNAALTGLGRTAISSAGSINSFGQAASSIKLQTLNNQLDDQRTRLGILSQQLTETSKKYGEGSTQAQSKQAALQRLTAQMSITQDKILAMTVQMEREAAAAQNAISPNDQLREAISRAAREAGEAGPKFNSFSEIAIGGLRRLGEVGVNALGNIAQGIGGFVKGSVTAAGDFEAALLGFGSVAGGALAESGHSLDDFKEKFLELGSVTQFSSGQAAQAAIELAKGGVAVADIMGGATEATLALAAAAGLDLAPAAEIVAKQLGVWGKDGLTASHAVDILAQAANTSTVDVDDLALGLSNVGGSARVAGVSFEETVTTLGFLAPGFSSAADAGTSFKTFLSRLPGTTGPSIKAMTDLGLYTKETGSVFYDAQGSFVGMEQAAQLLRDATSNLSEEQKTLAFNTIFGADAIRTAAGLAEGGASGLIDFGKGMEAAGSAVDQAAQKNQGFNFAMESLGGSISTLQTRIGDKLLPALTGLINDAIIPGVNATARFVENIGPLVESFKSAAGTASEILVPAIAGGTFAFGAFQIAAMGGVVPALATAGTALALAGSQFVTAAIAAGKATLAFAATALSVAAIAAPIAAIVYAFNKFNDKLEESKQQFIDSRPAIQGAKMALDDYNNAVLSVQETEAIKREKENLEALQRQYEALTARATGTGGFADAWAAFWDSDEVTAKQIEELKAWEAQIHASTGRLHVLTQAGQNQHQANLELAASEDAVMMAMGNTALGAEGLTQKVQLTQEQVDELSASLQKVKDEGPAAFAAVVQAQADYMSGTEGRLATHNATIDQLTKDREAATTETERLAIDERIKAENDGYAASQRDAAIAYATQQAQQREHLGLMLIEYATAQAKLNNVSDEALAELVGGIRDQYGVMEDVNATTFDNMTGSIDKWAESGGKNSAQLATDLGATTDAAALTQQQMDDLAKEYIVEITENFDPTKTSLAELTKQLQEVPARVRSEINVHTNYTSSGERPAQYKPVEAMATGGPANKNQPYLVGDGPNGEIGRWTEMFIPSTAGRILSAPEVQALIKNGAQPAGIQSASRGVSGGGVGAFSGAERAVAGSMNSLGKSMGGGFIAGIQTKLPAILDAGKTLSGSFVNGINEQVGKVRPALASSLGSIFTGAMTRPGAAFGSATRQAPISAAQLSAGTVSTMPVSNNVTKHYNLSLQQRQSTGSVMRDFRMIEALSIG